MTPEEKKTLAVKGIAMVERDLETPNKDYYNLASATGVLCYLAYAKIIPKDAYKKAVTIIGTMADDIYYENTMLYKIKSEKVLSVLCKAVKGDETK